MTKAKATSTLKDAGLEVNYVYTYDYPVNGVGIENSGHKIKGLLNTAIVLGYSFDSKITFLAVRTSFP